MLRGAFLIGFGLLVTGSAIAQQAGAPPATPTIKRTPLQRFDLAGTNLETVIGIAEIAPNAFIGRHVHAGNESGYLLSGEMVLMIQGQPDRSLKPGDSYQIAPAIPHDSRSGPEGAKVIATYIVEKGKPLATPTP